MSSRKLATNQAEWDAFLASNESGFVRTKSDWDSLAQGASNPLAGIDQKAIEDFTQSLEFRGGGLAHADYSSLVGKATPAQMEALWASFGLSMKLLTDYDNKYCKSTATCEYNRSSICTSNC